MTDEEYIEEDHCSWCGYEYSYCHHTGDRQFVFWEGISEGGIVYTCCCNDCYLEYNRSISALTFGSVCEE